MDWVNYEENILFGSWFWWYKAEGSRHGMKSCRQSHEVVHGRREPERKTGVLYVLCVCTHVHLHECVLIILLL